MPESRLPAPASAIGASDCGVDLRLIAGSAAVGPHPAGAASGVGYVVSVRIAVLGVGGIGSTFAAQLAGAGHDVTVIARNRRLEQVSRDGGIRTPDGVVATTVAGGLPNDVDFDLILVTVLAHQVTPLLPRLTASRGRTVMFMFNTFDSLSTLRDAVGDRFAFGFPAIAAQIDADGVLRASIQSRGVLTTVTDAKWAEVFTAAGIPAVTTSDMESWLRSHAAFAAPFMITVAEAHRAQRGISWSRARELAAAKDEAFALVRELGNEIIPAMHAVVGKVPTILTAGLLWAPSRVPAARASGAAGEAEPRALIAAMVAAANGDLPALGRV